MGDRESPAFNGFSFLNAGSPRQTLCLQTTDRTNSPVAFWGNKYLFPWLFHPLARFLPIFHQEQETEIRVNFQQLLKGLKENNRMENSVIGEKSPLNRKEKVGYCFCSKEIWFQFRCHQQQLELDFLDTAPNLRKRMLSQPNWLSSSAEKSTKWLFLVCGLFYTLNSWLLSFSLPRSQGKQLQVYDVRNAVQNDKLEHHNLNL